MTAPRRRGKTSSSYRARPARWLWGILAIICLVALLFWSFGRSDVFRPATPIADDSESTSASVPSTSSPETEAIKVVAPVPPTAPVVPRPTGVGRIEVTVTNRIGEAVGSAVVSLEPGRGNAAGVASFSEEKTTDAYGETFFDQLPAAYYIVEASQNGEVGWASTALGGRWPDASQVNVILKPAGTISGQVIDSHRTPIQNAEVTILDQMANDSPLHAVATDEEGNFSFPDLPVGQYRLQAIASGFATVKSGQLAINEAPVTLIMGKGAAIAGVLLRESDRSPVDGVTVKIIADDYKSLDFTVSSDVQGKFIAENLPVGVTLVTSDDPRYTFDPPQSTVTLGPGGIEHLEFLVIDGASVSGVVFDPSTDAALSGVVIVASIPDDHRRIWRAEPTDSEGYYHLDGLPSGTMSIRLGQVPSPYSRGLYDSEQLVTLSPGETLEDLDFAVPSGLMVCGIVVDEHDQPVAGATISLGISDPRHGIIGEYEHTTSDSSGAFCFANVAVRRISSIGGDTALGTVILEAKFRGERSEAITLSGVTDSVSDVRLKLLPQPSGAIAGQVVDERGKPAVASLRLSTPELSNEFNRRLGRSDADGHFLFQDLAAGDYEIWMAFDNGTGYNAGKKLALSLSLAAGERVTDLHLVVSEGGVITGTLLSAEGEPLPNAKIEAWDANDEEVSGAFTDREGNFRITSLEGEAFELRPGTFVPGGDWTVSAQSGEHVVIEVPAAPSIQRQSQEQGTPSGL